MRSKVHRACHAARSTRRLLVRAVVASSGALVGARIVHREAPQRRSCAAGQTGRNDVPDHERQEAGCFIQRESTRMRGSCWCSFGLFWSARAVAVARPPRTGRVLRSMNVGGQGGGRSSSGPRRRSTEASRRRARSLRRWCFSADVAPSARLEPRSGPESKGVSPRHRTCSRASRERHPEGTASRGEACLAALAGANAGV